MKKTILFGLAAVVVIAVITWNLLQLPVDIDKKPLILGHGGMGVSSAIPINSKSSIEKALSYPIQGTELDVRMTADEVLIAFHDNALANNTSCNGLVSETNLIDLIDCKNATWRNSEPISQLDQILSSGWVAGTTFSLDVKTDSEDGSKRSEILIEEIAFLMESYPELRFLIESQSIWLLKELKNLNTTAELFYYAHNYENDLELITQYGLNGISINLELISSEQIIAAQNSGYQVMLWGTGSVLSNRKTLKMGADIIQTDDIASMVNLLDLK